MRKFYYRIFSSFILLACFQLTFAQTANTYSFTASTGATIDPMTGSTSLISSGSDDGTSGLQSIGFSFTYEGISYSQFSVNSNGLMRLGSSAVSSEWANSITDIDDAPKIIPFWDDLATGSAAGGGKVHTVLIGTAPNRIRIVEWFVTIPRNTTGAANARFQAWLYETTNEIAFVYGTSANSATSASVGIGGITPANYISITTADGTSSSTSTNNANTVWPGDGTQYLFTPPPAPPTDLSFVSIESISTCPNSSVQVSATIKNAGSALLDFAVNAATITIDITGASTQTLDVTLNNGTLAPGATMTIPLFPNADFSAGGTHILDGSLTMAGDASTVNNSIPAVNVNIVFSTVLPVENNLTGFTGSNLNAVFPLWKEGTGASAPVGTTSNWTSQNGLGGGGNVTARMNLYTNTNNSWIVGPQFPVNANTVLSYEVAVTDWSFSGTSDPDVMGSDDRVSVMVSTDCGLTWTEIKAHTVADNISNSLTPQSVSLAPYAGQDIMIAFRASDGPVDDSEDYDFQLDNIMVSESCAGTPEPGTLTGPSLACSGVDFTLTVAGATTGAGISYQWESSDDGSTWTPIAGATSATLNISQTSETYYRRLTICGTDSDVSNDIQVGMEIATNCYCESSSVTTTFEYIADVEITGGINNTGTPPSSYTNYSATEISTVYQGQSVTVTISGGTEDWYSTDVAYIFVDFNQDGDFTDAGELVGSGTGSTQPYVINFVVPSTATLGTTRLRIKFGDESIFNVVPMDDTPCQIGYDYGETEDYGLTITPPPPCVEPNTVIASGVSNTTASIIFTSTGTNFIVEYGPTGFTPGTDNLPGTNGTIVTGTDSPIALSGLTANTTYQVYVRQDCGSGTISDNSTVISFTTLCDPVDVPYVQDFNGVTTPAIPLCTTRENVNGATTWTTVTAPTGYTGFSLQYSWDGSTPGDDWFYTQGLNLTGGTMYRLVFRYGNNSTFFSENMKVAYGTSAEAAAMTNLLVDHPNINDNTPHQDTIKFTPATTGVYYIGFHNYSDADMFNMFLDDISVIKEPTIDVTPIAVVTPPITCPINLITVQATIRNEAMFPLDLALNPVTVTATVSGAGTGSLSGTLNTGTLAPGATMNVFLSPSFDFTVGGAYVFDVTTTQAGDEISSNDDYSTTINVNPVPPVTVFTPANPAVCSTGGTTQLVASGSNSTGSITLGNGTGTSATTTPYKGFWGAQKAQYLYRASELTAMGLTAGSAITTLSFNVSSFNSPYTFNGFTIAMKNTTTNTLTSTLETGTTTVLPASNFVLAGTAPFTVSHTLATPFVWDGTSNLLVETCFNNNNSGGGSTKTAAVFTSSVSGAVSYYSSDNNSTACSAPGFATTSSDRPNATFGFESPASYTWAPLTDLYEDAAGTIPYTGTATSTVYAMPATASTYTVTATSAAGCVTTTDVTVTVNDPVTINTQPQSQVVCTGNTVTLSVDATNASGYQWMKNGVDISGATDASYIIGNFGLTDTGTYSVTVLGLSPCGAVTSDNAVISFSNNNSWVGTSNSDWNNPANWCSGVPTETTNVMIVGGTPFAPVIQGNAPANNVIIGIGATLQVTSSGRLKLHGNLTNDGSMDAASGTIEFMGAANQDVTAITAANIIMNGDGGITLTGDMNIGTALSMDNGNITLGDYNLVMNGGSVGSASSHIITNGTGKVTNTGIGAVSVVFPVGPSADSYNPVTIANGQGRDYTVGVVTGLPAAPALANTARAVNRTWNITADQAPTSPVNISLQYADDHGNASVVPTANMYAGVSTATNWVIVSPASGMLPTGSAAGRNVHYQTATLGQTVVANIGGINFPNAVGNIDADITGVTLMPNVVDNMTLLRVKSLRTTKVNWSVIDATGKVVMTFSNQVFAGQNDIQLSLGRLAGGSYQLIGETEKGKIETVRFVRQ